MRLGAEIDIKTHDFQHENKETGAQTNITFHQLITQNSLLHLRYRKRVLHNNYLIFAVNEEQQCANFELIVNRFVQGQFKIDLSHFFNGIDLKMCTRIEQADESEGGTGRGAADRSTR